MSPSGCPGMARGLSPIYFGLYFGASMAKRHGGLPKLEVDRKMGKGGGACRDFLAQGIWVVWRLPGDQRAFSRCPPSGATLEKR